MFISRDMFLPRAVTVNLMALYTGQYYAALLSDGLHTYSRWKNELDDLYCTVGNIYIYILF
jgi:hypothetical protein